MDKIVRMCVLKMIEKNIIEERQCAVITYGLDLFFSSIINILSILLISVIIGKEGGTFLILLVSIPLQSFGGGYHCNTHLMCWVLTIAGYLITLLGALCLPTGVLLSLAAVSAYPFFRFSPVENPKAPFGLEFKIKMKKVAHITYLGGVSVALFLLAFGNGGEKFILASISMEGCSVFCAECRRKRRLE